MNRREFLEATAAFGGLIAAQSLLTACATTGGLALPMGMTPVGGHELPALPYAYDALEPHLDAETMRLHHSRHHAGYVAGLNAAELKMRAMLESGNTAAIKSVARELAFHGSGHLLHSIFWTGLAPDGGGEPSGALAEQIVRDFGSFGVLQQTLSAAALSVEGSGWGILAWDGVDGRLRVLETEKHQEQAVWGTTPIFVMDVWEHAYYLKYQNRRKEFIAALWKVANWRDVAARLERARPA